MSSLLERIVMHESRLTILSCLVESGALTLAQVSAGTGRPTPTVAYHLELLGEHGLVAREGDGGELEATCFEVTLDEQPEWVAGAVRDHRQDG